ncbi:hypothetical protein C6503_13260 [Candidatus Poribacteria bacterium]|nr:MAG: hypothetical protein C6503_13260 [Candidatus Poribacteria bacterium]
MLSKKMAVSLTSLIIIFALAFVVPSAMANEIKLRVKDANHGGPKDPADVSAEDGIQVLAGTHAMIKLTSAEPLVAGDVVAGAFELVGAAIADTDGIVRVNASEYTITLGEIGSATDGSDAGKEVTIYVVPKKFASATTGDKDSTGVTLKFKYVAPDTGVDAAVIDEPNNPKVVSITRATAIGSTVASAFIEEAVSGEFMVKIVLTEQPNGGLHSAKLADRIKAVSASNATVTNVVIGQSIDRGANNTTNPLPEADGGYDVDGTPADPIPNPTGRDNKYYTYLATIAPSGAKTPVVVQVNSFKDLVLTQGEGTDIVEPGEYKKPVEKAAAANRDKLEVKVVTKPAAAKTAGLSVGIPNDIIIPAAGYLVVAKDDGDGDDNHEKRTDSTAIVYPGDPKDDEILVGDRQPAQRMYNVIKAGLPNLETFLTNGGTIVLMGPSGLVISEIMWGTDASLTESFESQWIEIMNPGTQVKTKDVKLVFYGPGASDQAAVAALDATKVADTVGTVGASGYWSIAGKGQSGRTGVGESPGDAVAVTPTLPLISMQRAITAGVAADGTMASSWAASVPPPLNFDLNKEGSRIGTPGAAPAAYPVAPTAEPEPVVVPPTPAATAADIMITEIMVDTGNGRLPQWIELNNVSGKEVSLAGWSLEIENDPADTDAISSRIEIDLMGTLGVSANAGNMGKGNSLLLVSRTGRSSANLEGNKNIVNVQSEVGATARGHYKLISDMAFMITLVPPQETGVFTPGDMAGNLDASPAWEIPMSEDGRSSLIRREMLDDGMATMGTDANGWILASDTSLVSGPQTWYGSDEDAGTPGYDAGGPLPVELSHFRPARDKQTGAVVITWATQSELNNAGFFIKRSNQRNGEFKVVNPTMIPGAGTTSEKQFYTYTDTTAQPNVVYYYQIEDVSLDGNRQLLTRGTRLRGHIGAAGKATVIWGELKESQ